MNNYGIKPNKIYVYLRVSSRTQINKTNGIKDQYNICSDYLKKNFKSQSADYYEEIGSSYNNKNKLLLLNKIIRKLESNSVLIIRDISRLGRNSFQVFSLLQKIKKLNCYIISVNDNISFNYSRLMDKTFYYKIIDAEKDSDLKNVVMTKHIAKIKQYGGFFGKPPFGTIKFKINGIPKLFKNQTEIKIINLLKKMYNKDKNISKIIQKLNSNKILYRGNKNWSNYIVKNLLNRNLNKFPNLPNNILNCKTNEDLIIKIKKLFI